MEDKLCPVALSSGNTYHCNGSCAFCLPPDGDCLLAAALKKYVNEKPAAAVTYPHESGGDSHSDYWGIGGGNAGKNQWD